MWKHSWRRFSFEYNGFVIGFHPQTHKLELRTSTMTAEKGFIER